MPGMNVTNASFKWAGSALVPWWVHIKCNKQNALFYLITISFFFGSVVSSLLHGLFSSCGKWGLFSSCSVWVSHCSDFSRWGARTLVSAGFSHGSSHAPEHRLNSCGTWAWLLHGMWDFPRSGINPVSSALAANSLPLRHHGSIECLVLKIIVFSIPLLSTQEYNMWNTHSISWSEFNQWHFKSSESN